MNTSRVIYATACVVVVLSYAAGSGWWVSTGDDWYQRLERPAWQPPDIVFGLIWPYNFAVLIAASIVVTASGTSVVRWVWIVGLVASVVAALAWARLFYVDHALWHAAAALMIATVVTVPIVTAAFATRRWAGVILLPYQVWLALAASLSVGYARLN